MTERLCDDCGSPLVELDVPIPLRVWDCPKCSEDGPTQAQIEWQMSYVAPRPFTMLDKDDPGRYRP